MPGYNGSGTYQRFRSWEADAAAGVKIRADYHDDEDDGFAAGLSNVICRDGQSTVVANIPFNAKKITNLAAGTDPTDAINLGQLTAFRTFPTGIVISGSGASGMVNFTGATAPVGLSFTQNDTSWIARNAGTPANMPNRLALNDKADGTGIDRLFIDESGRITSNSTTPVISNGFNDGTGWRVVNAGWMGLLSVSHADGSFAYFTHAATAAAGAVVSIISPFNVDKNGNVNAAGVMQATAGFVQTGANWICGPSSPGSVRFRPNGWNIGASEAVISSDGQMTIASKFNPGSGFSIKAGSAGGVGASSFNINWTGSAAQLWIDATNTGLISVTSDYRIKKDVADLPSTWEQVKALRPIKYTQADFQPPMSDETKAVMLQKAVEQYAAENGIEVDEVDPQDIPEAKPAAEPLFKADDIERWGFIAHELQETLVHSAAEGEKDMEDGVQSLNLASILAATVKALQEAMTRIEALEAA